MLLIQFIHPLAGDRPGGSRRAYDVDFSKNVLELKKKSFGRST